MCDGTSAVGESRHRIRIRWSDEDLTARFAAGLHCSALVRKWHIAAPDVCDGTSAVGESRHRIPGASVGQPSRSEAPSVMT